MIEHVLIEAKDLVKNFKISNSWSQNNSVVQAVSNINIKIFEGEFERKFDEIRNKIYECHNISSLQSINSEIHVLKINMLNKISQEEKKVAEEKLTYPERVATDSSQNTPTLTKVKKHKNISIKNLDTGYSWRIESLEDIDKYIDQLRENLMKELEQEENTIINIVF